MMPCSMPYQMPVAVIGRAHRRVHLRKGAEPLVAFGRGHGQMMRRRLAGRDVLVVAQILDLLLGRDVQDVDALSRLAREIDQPLGRHQRRGLVAPHRMRARIALDAERLALVEAVFILGMERGAATDHLEYPPQALVVLDQQRAGGGADEYFHAGATWRAFQFRQILNVLAGAADEERKIAMHAVTAALHLVGEGGFRDGQRIGVRHLEHRGDPAHHGTARSGFKIFLMRLARLAEMHLRIHHAGQDVQALAVDRLGGGRLPQPADRGDPAIGNADVADALAVLIDHGAGF